MNHPRLSIGLICAASVAALMARGPSPLGATEAPVQLLPFPPAGRCVPNRNLGCANQGRFSVAVSWHNQFNDTSGSGVVVTHASTDETLAFTFGDPANIELLVKILNFGDVVKLFYGELTDLQFQITVTDTTHGTTKVYTNTPGDCGAIDETAFPGQSAKPGEGPGESMTGDSFISGDPATAVDADDTAAAGAATGSCRPDATTLCLLGGRFAASVSWWNQFGGVFGSGMAGPLSTETGTFYFTDPTNKELLVKILDFGDRIAVFYGSLSNLQYTLQVTNTSTGGTKTYFNPPGTFCGGLDNAFPSNLVASTSFKLRARDVVNLEHFTDDVALVPFTTTAAGNLQINADWVSAADDIQIFVFRGDCTLQEDAKGLCDVNQIASGNQFVKPQQVVLPNLPAGTYTIQVLDWGPGSETGTMTATFAP